METQNRNSDGRGDRGGDRRAKMVRLNDKELAAAGFPPETAKIKRVKDNSGGLLTWRRPVVAVKSKPGSTERPPVLSVRNNGDGFHNSKQPFVGVGSKPEGSGRPPVLSGSGLHSLKRPAVGVESKPEDTVSLAVRNSGSNGSRNWRRPVVAVRSMPGGGKSIFTASNETIDIRRKNLNFVEPREKVWGLLELFRATCSKLRRNSAAGLEDQERRVDLKAWKELVNEGLIPNRPERILGTVPGIDIGDKFSYRIELLIAGLHSRTQNGIDYTTHFCRYKLATCVVAVEGYSDNMNDSNILWYTGEGGFNSQSKSPKDQKLSAGNLALYNSKIRNREVRVVRGLKNIDHENPKADKVTYIYDGLYDVTHCKEERGPMGNMVYRFQLTRRPNQKFVDWKGFHR